MKKIFGFLLCALVLTTKIYAEEGIPTEKQYTFDRTNVATVLAEFIEDEKLAQKAADKYNELSREGSEKISAVDFVDVCVVGGMNIKATDGSGYTKCLEMFMRLIEMQNQDIGDFNMYCPATGNTLKSITDKNQVGDVCGGTSDTYIEYGFITLKAVDSNAKSVKIQDIKNNKAGEHQYVCTCTAKSCKDGYRFNKETYQCSNKDKEGYCLRHILGSYEYKNGKLPTDSGVGVNNWTKKNNAYYNDKYAQINANTDARDKCIQYGIKNNCAIRGALASADVSSGFGTAKKYQVICNPENYEIAADKKVQEEKQKQYEDEARQYKKSNLKYYSVCGDDKGKTGGTEHCIDIFNNIEVQVAQAKNLAVEYAKEKYNDEIECDMSLRSVNTQMGGGTYGSAVNVPLRDYLKCTSIKGNVFYEFEFDDAKESNSSGGKFVKMEFGRGLCFVYGGKAYTNLGKALVNINDRVGRESFVSTCLVSYGCDKLNSKLSKWGYTSSDVGNGKCKISIEEEKEGSLLSNDYYAKFDGKTLSIYYKGNIIRSWPAVSGRGKTKMDSRPTICQLPKYQRCANIGPTPSGIYYISQNDIQYGDNITMGGYNRDIPFTGLADDIGWGKARVLLKPDDSTELYGRAANMYIHGGEYKGSMGCIDLTNKISEFMDWFAKQTDFVELKVVVDYGVIDEVCIECSESTCAPCKCITSVDDCDYL